MNPIDAVAKHLNALNTLSKLVQNKTRYFFVLQAAYGAALIRWTQIIFVCAASVLVVAMWTPEMMAKFGHWMGLIGIGIFFALTMLRFASQQINGAQDTQ